MFVCMRENESEVFMLKAKARSCRLQTSEQKQLLKITHFISSNFLVDMKIKYENT